MKFLMRLISGLAAIILPHRVYSGVVNRCKRIKIVMTNTQHLKLFWNIILWPIKVVADFLVSSCKALLIIIFPMEFYGGMAFIVKQLLNDLCDRKIGIKLAMKRTSLYFQLFTKGAECSKSFGKKNPDKQFYVVRPYFFLEPNEVVFRNIPNLLTQYYYCLQKISYAVENGYIPVVDWEHYGKMPHSEDYPIHGTMNAWEYYWTQPSEYTLEEVYQSKHVILSTQNIGQFGYIPDCPMSPPMDIYAKDLAKKCPQYARLFDFNESTMNYVNNAYEKLFPKNNDRVMGVVVRGSSYGSHSTPYSSHPMQVSMGKLIGKVRKYMEEWDMQYIFFVNEMQELVDAMVEAFGNRVIVLPRLRDHQCRPADGITKNPMYADGQKYQTNLDYLTEIALLSRCDSLLGSMSSGMRTAIIMNADQYENVKVIDKGLW